MTLNNGYGSECYLWQRMVVGWDIVWWWMVWSAGWHRHSEKTFIPRKLLRKLMKTKHTIWVEHCWAMSLLYLAGNKEKAKTQSFTWGWIF